MPPVLSWIECPPPKGKGVRSNRAGGATSPTAAAPLQPRFRHSRAGGNPATSPSAKSGTRALGPRLRGDDGQDKASRRTIAGVSMTHPVLTPLGLSDNESGPSPRNGEWSTTPDARLLEPVNPAARA